MGVIDVLSNVYYYLANPAVFWGALALVALFWFVLFPLASRRYRLPDDPSIIALQLAFTKRRFVEILDTWMEHKGAQAIRHLRASLWQLDILFPIFLGLLGASAIALLTSESPPTRLALSLLLLPLGATVADLAENLVHYWLLRGVRSPADLPRLSARLIWLASAFASLKMLLLADTAQVILVLLVLRLF